MNANATKAEPLDALRQVLNENGHQYAIPRAAIEAILTDPHRLTAAARAEADDCRCGFRAPELGPHPACPVHGTQAAVSGAYRPTRAEVWREMTRLINAGLPVPYEARFYENPDSEFHEGGFYGLNLTWNTSAQMEAWARSQGWKLDQVDVVHIDEDGIPRSWQYRCEGKLLGYYVGGLVIHSLPDGIEPQGPRPAEASAVSS